MHRKLPWKKNGVRWIWLCTFTTIRLKNGSKTAHFTSKWTTAFAEPNGWCAGAVLVVVGAVCVLAVPSSWRTEVLLVVAGVVRQFLLPMHLRPLAVHNLRRCQITMKRDIQLEMAPNLLQVMRIRSAVVLSNLEAGFEPLCPRKECIYSRLLAACLLLLLKCVAHPRP